VVAEGLSVRAVEELVTLGDHREKTARQRHQSKIVAPKAKDLADRLSDHFETRVKVELGRTKGKIIIEFATIDDLERIVALIGNEQMRPERVEQLGQAQPTAQQYRQSDIQEEAGAEATVSA
jgi:ParB family chromosome partitioning protein